MPLHGPASVLDSREIDKDTTTHVVRDRLTRHRSPARFSNRYSYTSDEGGEEEEFITPRVPQPYKTSFSAIAPPQRGKRDRSRSTSPCTSSLKGINRSRSKSPGGRKSHKHVTYNENVVIRESDTSDSIVTHLSDKDFSDSYSNKCENSVNMSNSSQRDYSSELRELSQQIVREYSGLNNEEIKSSDLPSHDERKVNGKGNTPNGNAKTVPDFGSRNPRQNVKIYKDSDKPKRIVVNEDYDHDRSVSYRVAIKNNYSDEIKQQAEEAMKENGMSLPAAETPKDAERESRPRRSSEPSENDDNEPSRLTPAKRSISASIGNFFRRLSPRVGRKNRKGNLSNASSQSLSPSDEHDGSFRRHNSTSSLSRGKLRRSLMKLMGKSSKKDKSFNKSELSIEDLNHSNNSQDREPAQSAPKSSLYMKSIEQSSKTDKDIYQKFKEKQTTPKSGESKPVKPMKVAPRFTSPDGPSTTETSITSSVSAEALNSDRVLPPDSLDVKLIPKSIRSLQASQISTISGDDSIGECSIDPNLTGSEPSLLSETSASKQVEVSHTSQENVTLSTSQPLSSELVQNEDILQRSASDSNRSERKRVKELKLSYPQMPIIADSAEYIPKDTPPRTPSYLRISSAVSGYGHYSKYSAYKGIEKRSPYSSTLSLRSSRSDLTTPLSPAEMPIGKIPNIQPPTNYPPIKSEILSPKSPTANNEISYESVVNGASPVINSHVNGDTGCDIAVNGENGHVTHVGNFVSTGDIHKDADYFLDVAKVEEDRLLLLCSKCEMEILSESISEEASGKIRAAVGKANLLISQKFRQFQDLCQHHKHPDPDSKETKCEDLQGFWEMVKLQVDDVDEMFTEIDMMRQNGWREIKIPSRRSSSSSRSSPKSSSLNVSNASTPSHTPGSRRRAARVKDTPESSPERSQKAKMAAKIRDDARKKMLAEKRAAMKQQRQQEADNVEIYVADKSDSPGPNSGSEGAEA